MSIAFFSTWTTYGTWLPGDPRGWFKRGRGLQEPDPLRQFEATLNMTEAAVALDDEQRRIVEKTIADHCGIRKWLLHAVNCRSNHVHVVVSAPGRKIEVPREQFKAWCTRNLMSRERSRLASHGDPRLRVGLTDVLGENPRLRVGLTDTSGENPRWRVGLTEPVRENWWTERGWDEHIDDEESLANVIVYVRDGQ